MTINNEQTHKKTHVTAKMGEFLKEATDTRLCSGESMLCKLRLSKIGNFVSWHDESLLIAQHRLLSVLIIASSHDDCDKAC